MKNEDKGMVNRLKDQLRIQKQVNRIHENPRLLKEIAFYPEHDKRRETNEYKAVHKKLTQELDLPCLICGITNSTLKDKQKNLYGAKQMETHHHIIEWALANAVSVEKFNASILPHLRQRHPDKSEYKQEFTDEDIRNWVDHSEDNLWVLCDVHHRAKYLGIHEITDPIWGPQDLLRDDFEEYARKEIAKVESKKVSKKKKG
jgi:L-rhamnose mutarotase